MAIRLSGLTSGMDTDAIVQELVSAYSKKTEKYEKASTKLTWKQDSWKALNTKIYDLYTKVSNMRFSSAYNLRKTTVSDATKATVTASSGAVTGTQTLNIKSTAQSAYMTGAQLPEFVTDRDDDKSAGETTLKELGYTGKYTNIKYKTATGEVKEIGVDKDTTITDFITKLKEAGLNASFDENNRRIFVNAKTSGTNSDFTLLGESADAQSALEAFGLNSPLIEYEYNADGTVKKDENGNPIKKFTEAAGSFAVYYKYAKGEFDEPQQEDYGLNTPENGNAQLVAYDEIAQEAFQNANALYNHNHSSFSLEERIARVYDTYVAYFRANDAAKIAYNTIENQNGAYKNLNKLYDGQIEDAVDSVYSEMIGKDENGDYLYSFDGPYAQDDIRVVMEKVSEVVTTENYTDEDIENKLKEVYPDMSPGDVKEFAKLFRKKAEDVKNVAELNGKIKDNNEAVEKNNETLDKLQTQMNMYQKFIDDNAEMANIETEDKDGNHLSQEEINAQLEQFVAKAEKAQEIYEDADGKYSSTTDKAVKIKGSNAEIMLNGVTYTSETNSFAINGLTINTLAVTNGDISITTTVDSQGIYDKVKEFLTEYNNVINEMTKLYNAESASDYEPLTDEEKEAMSDEQIEKWENKIKDSLLRRDTTLNSIMSVMVNAMAQTIEIDGQKLSLSSFGIMTLGFLNAPKNEQYAYHINGDADDENTSGKEDELMKAIEANPDQVEAFMKQLSVNLYTAIDNKMKSTELSSAYKVYNDKEMDKELTKYAQAISKWEEKVADKEDYYYKKFSQMEVALAKLQEQTSSISGLLGM